MLGEGGVGSLVRDPWRQGPLRGSLSPGSRALRACSRAGMAAAGRIAGLTLRLRLRPC